MSSNGNHLYEFDEYALDTRERSLRRNGEIVQIVPKALELLILLVNRRGEVVSREDLLENVWHETFVEEGNINYTISLLRKTFGEKVFIKTLPKQGYVFTAKVRDFSRNGHAGIDVPQTDAAVEVPARQTRWVLLTTLALGLLFVTSFVMLSGSDEPPTKPEASPTQNAEAMQAYTRGRMILETKDAERRAERAVDEFQKAITLDPTFALAYVGLGEGFLQHAVKASYPQSLDYYAKAQAAAHKAVNLNEATAEAWSLRGWLKRNADWDWAGAESDLRRSIQLNPKNGIAHYRLAYVLTSTGKLDEALAEINIANELDPISDFIQAGRSPILEARGEYDTALKIAEDFLRENKGNSNAKRAVATFLYHKRDLGRVIEMAEGTLEKESGKNAFAWYSLAAAAYAQAGQPDNAAQILARLEQLAQDDTKALYSLVMNYAELGRTDEAITALEKCIEMREERMVWVNVEPRFAGLRADPRFQQILARMHLQ